MNKLPQVVLVGRMNVGKSTLFNRISKKTKPLVFDFEGVTRDFVRDVVSWKNTPFLLSDTGGIGLKQLEDPITEQVRLRALSLAESADLVLFMVDGSIGLTPKEFELAKYLHKNGRHVFVVANKADIKTFAEHELELQRLGFDTIVSVSAVHNQGINELLDKIVTVLPRKKLEKVETYRSCRVTLLGRPNVGKSSLLNKLLKEERAIVTDVAGTTREAITEPLSFYSETIELTDTAGVRRKKNVDEPLEELMVKSTMQAVRTSDIVLLLLDAQEARLVDQELKLAFYAFEQGKAVIILINKDDLVTDYAKEGWRYHKDEYEFFFKKLETLSISCKTGKNIGKLLPLITKVWHAYLTEFSELEISTFLKQALIRRPLYKQEHQLVLKSARQIKIGPPIFKVRVNYPQFFGDREFSYFENVMRAEYDLKSVPVQFVTEEKKKVFKKG